MLDLLLLVAEVPMFPLSSYATRDEAIGWSILQAQRSGGGLVVIHHNIDPDREHISQGTKCWCNPESFTVYGNTYGRPQNN